MADATKPTALTPTAAGAQLAFRLTPINKSTSYLKMLIYGAYGSGKTTLAATAADVEDMADVLFIDAESGQMTIEDNPRIKNIDRITRVRITSFKQLAAVHEFVKAHCRFRDMPFEQGEPKLKELQSKFTGTPIEEIEKAWRFRTIIIDSLSELDQICMYELLGISSDMNLNEALVDNDVEVAQFAEFRKNNQMMQLIVRAYRDLPVHVFLVCHEQYTQDEMKRMFYAPGLTGKLAKQIQGFVDIVGFLKVGTPAEGQASAPRRLYVQPAGKFDAKCRRASLKETHFDDPTMSSIWKALQKGVATNQQPKQ